MERRTAYKIYDVVLARIGLKDKPGEQWTDEEESRFVREIESMPGEFRVFHSWNKATSDGENKKIAGHHGMDVGTLIRLSATGNTMYMRNVGRPESDLAKPNPGIPGNTFGIAIIRNEITPS